MRGIHFQRNFWKIFKNEDFGLNIFEKGQIYSSFSGLASSKLKIREIYYAKGG